MELVLDERSANSSFVEMIWHTHSEHAGTFTSVAVSNWEMVLTTFKGKTMIIAVDRGEDGRTGPNPDTFAYIPG